MLMLKARTGKTETFNVNLSMPKYFEGYGGQWIPTKSYPYSGLEFSQLTDVEEAVKAYCFERERAGVVALDERIQNGKNWFEYLSGTPLPPTPPTPPTPTPSTRRHMSIYMMLKRRF